MEFSKKIIIYYISYYHSFILYHLSVFEKKNDFAGYY